MSAASSSRTRVGVAAALVIVGGYLGCGFPDHTFVEDSQFYAQGGAGNVGNTGGGGTGGLGGVSGGGTGATGGGPGGAGGSGASGGGTGNENCTNGVDDDSDTQIDCADPDCQAGFTCAPTVPAGWTGPVAFYEGTDPAPLCNVSGGYPTQKQSAHSGIIAGTATCETCACNPMSPVCVANLVFSTDPTCTAGQCWGQSSFCPGATPNLAVNGTCFSIGMCQFNGGATKSSSLEVTEIKVNGTCQSNPSGTTNIPTPDWTNEIRACGDAVATGKGCGTDGMCLPIPVAPFGAANCIYKTGDTACPSPYSTKHLVHQDFLDTRSCTPCTCGTISGTCSGGSVTSFTSQTCSQDPQVMTLGGACNALTADPTPTAPQPGCANLPADTRSVLLTGATVQGTPTCPTSGGQISGAATATGPTTFCCL